MAAEEEKAFPTTENAQAKLTQKITTADSSGAVNRPTSKKKDDDMELPDIMSWGDLKVAELDKREEVICGLLREGCKLGIAGGAKAKKTWLLLALACNVAAGGRWFDRFNTVPRKVLYVNLELH